MSNLRQQPFVSPWLQKPPERSWRSASTAPLPSGLCSVTPHLQRPFRAALPNYNDLVAPPDYSHVPDYLVVEPLKTVEDWHGDRNELCPWDPPPKMSMPNRRTWEIHQYWQYLYTVDDRHQKQFAASVYPNAFHQPTSLTQPTDPSRPARVPLDSDAQDNLNKENLANVVNEQYKGPRKLLGGGKARIVKNTPVVTRGKKPKFGTVTDVATNPNPNGRGKYWMVEFHDRTKKVLSSASLQVAGTTTLFVPPSIRPDYSNLPRNPNDDSHLADNHDDWKSESSDDDESDIEELGPESGPNDTFDPSKDIPVTYQQKLSKARYDLKQLIGEKVLSSSTTTTTGRSTEWIEWEVIQDHIPKQSKPRAIPPSGLVSFEWLVGSEDTPLARLFCHLMFPNLIDTLRRYNKCVEELIVSWASRRFLATSSKRRICNSFCRACRHDRGFVLLHSWRAYVDFVISLRSRGGHCRTSAIRSICSAIPFQAI
jgi:hypothetical protein